MVFAFKKQPSCGYVYGEGVLGSKDEILYNLKQCWLYFFNHEWRKIHCPVHWALVSVSQNARWYFQKLLKRSLPKACCSCRAASGLSSERLEQGVPQVPEGELKPTTVFSQLPQRGWGKHSLADTAFSLCVPGGHAWVGNRCTERPVLYPVVYWYTGVICHDLGLLLTTLYLHKTEGIRDNLGPEGERWD